MKLCIMELDTFPLSSGSRWHKTQCKYTEKFPKLSKFLSTCFKTNSLTRLFLAIYLPALIQKKSADNSADFFHIFVKTKVLQNTMNPDLTHDDFHKFIIGIEIPFR